MFSYCFTVYKYSGNYLSQFATNIDFTGKALANHVCNTIEVYSVEECFRHCIKTFDKKSSCKCYSINIIGMRNGGKGVCEINGGDEETFPLDFINRNSCQYYDAR